MWQGMSFVFNHEHASEFVSTILDAFRAQAPKPSNPQCQPQAQWKAAGQAKRKGTTLQGWLLCFPRTKSWSSDFIRTDVVRTSMCQEK